MKSFLKIISAVALTTAACLTANRASAQQSIATWDTAMNGPGGPAVTNIAVSVPFTNNTAAANVIVTPMTKGSGIGAITTAAVYGGNGWTNNVVGGTGATDTEANAIAGGHYITYAIQAAPGYTISFSTNVSFTHNSATGPYNGELQYSTNGINYTDIAAMTYTNGNIAASPVLTVNLSTNSFLQNIAATTTNYFRIVNWGATALAGTWYFYNPTIPPGGALLNGTNEFAVFGSVTPVPPGQNLATWDTAMNGPGGPPVTNTAVSVPFTNNTAAANVIVTPMAKGPGIGAITTANVYGGNTWTNVGFADNEADSIANGLYITYAVQAAPGYTVSFFTNEAFIHYSSTGPSQGELQYSTNGITYSDIVPITYGTAGVTTSAVITNNLTGIQFLQNVPSTITNFFRIVNWGATGTGGTWYLYNPTIPAGTLLGTTNEFVVYGGLTSLNGVVAPTNLVVSPTNITANAGQTVSYSAAYFGSPASNFWYQIAGSTTNLIPWATSSTLTLTNVLGGTPTNYFVILTNSAGSATSAVVALNVQNDPNIIIQPNSAQGLLDGTVQFSVTAVGTSPNYQWYFANTSGTIIAPVGSLGDGSVISGGNTSTLTFANLQATDLTNFVVVVYNAYGAVTSSVASVLGNVNNPGNLSQTQGMLSFWDFDGSQFTNTAANPNSEINPVPLIGNGTAAPVGSTLLPGTSPFSGSVDPGDVAGVFTPYGFPQLSPNFSWGVDNFPASGSNKQNGVQFNVSTVGAKNITVTYDARVSATASDYHRLQYTTNGTAWIDYPASSTFAGLASTYYSFAYSLAGFPGVANNPNFGVRIVTEAQNTATYGISSNTNYLGAANTYGTGGTFTFDLVAVQGDAITNGNVPPVLGSISNTNMVDTNSLTLNFTVTPGTTPANSLTYSAVALPQINQTEPQSSSINPNFAFGGSGNNRTLTVSFGSGYIPDANDAGPILVTATDANGDSAATWFVLSASSINQPPTNSLTSLTTTNTLVNTALTIPFTVGSARNGYTNLTFTVTSDNNTVIPAGNIVIGGNTNTANRTLTITPASEQVGNALITVTVNDNDPVEPRSTTANISIAVKPNPGIVAIDYFNYDSSGSLDSIAAGYWQHLSGVNGQLQAGGGVATVDTADNTENLVAPLVGSPYATNSGKVLYAGMTVNMNGSAMPTANGSYFVCFQNGFTVAQNGSGATTYVEGLLVAATNGAAPGYYRLGVANASGDTALDAQMFPQDLSPGNNYFVVMSLVLSNGFTTLWINPTNQSAQHVVNTAPAATPTNLYSISDIELRESGVNAGSVTVGDLLVGLSFQSVIYPPVANPDNYTVNSNSVNNVLNALTNDVSGGILTIVSAVATSGTAAVDGTGTNVLYTPPGGFTGTDTINYTIQDNLGNTSSSTITVTVVPGAVVPTVPPAITGSSFNFLNGNLVITGTNAQSTGVYYLLESTNVATPLSQWIPVATNVVGTNGPNGSFSFIGTNVVTPSGNRFYILSSTNN